MGMEAPIIDGHVIISGSCASNSKTAACYLADLEAFIKHVINVEGD